MSVPNLTSFFYPTKPVQKVYVYTDGSYSNLYMDRYAGAFLVYRGVQQIYQNSGCGTKAASMRNVAGELSAVMHAAHWLKQKGYKGVIIYDYEGIEKWLTGEWQTKKEWTKRYKKFMMPYIKAGIIEFKWTKAHNGDLGNSMADKLARATLVLGKEWS